MSRCRSDAFGTSSENKKRGSGQPEKDKVHRDDVIEDLLVTSAQRNHDRPDALQHDRNDWDVSARRNARDRAKKKSVLGHGEINTRRGENGLREKAECRNGDGGGDEIDAARPESGAHES